MSTTKSIVQLPDESGQFDSDVAWSDALAATIRYVRLGKLGDEWRQCKPVWDFLHRHTKPRHAERAEERLQIAAENIIDAEQDLVTLAWSMTRPQLEDAPAAALDLYSAAHAISAERTWQGGPWVLMSNRFAVAVIERLTGRTYDSKAMTRARRWLEQHGFIESEAGVSWAAAGETGKRVSASRIGLVPDDIRIWGELLREGTVPQALPPPGVDGLGALPGIPAPPRLTDADREALAGTVYQLQTVAWRHREDVKLLLKTGTPRGKITERLLEMKRAAREQAELERQNQEAMDAVPFEEWISRELSG